MRCPALLALIIALTAPGCAGEYGTFEEEAAATCADAGLVVDGDGDGFVDPVCGGTDCDDTDGGAHPAAVESCDEVDEDCDGVDDWDEDDDGDGKGPCTADCDDGNPNIHSGAPEAWNDEVDSDCDGQDDPII